MPLLHSHNTHFIHKYEMLFRIHPNHDVMLHPRYYLFIFLAQNPSLKWLNCFKNTITLPVQPLPVNDRIIWKMGVCITAGAHTRNCRCCSSVGPSWREGVGLRPGGSVTRSHDSSSAAGVFSHLDEASSNPTHRVFPKTWGVEKKH